MKTRKTLFGLFLVFWAVFAMVSCDKEDEVKISQLEGTWNVANDDPRLVVEGGKEYTFNADNSCSIYSYDVLCNRDTTINRTYVISLDHRLITIFKEDPDHKGQSVYTEQYHIRKLTSEEMKWENASPNDGNPDKMRLVRVKWEY